MRAAPLVMPSRAPTCTNVRAIRCPGRDCADSGFDHDGRLLLGAVQVMRKAANPKQTTCRENGTRGGVRKSIFGLSKEPRKRSRGETWARIWNFSSKPT